MKQTTEHINNEFKNYLSTNTKTISDLQLNLENSSKFLLEKNLVMEKWNAERFIELKKKK